MHGHKFLRVGFFLNFAMALMCFGVSQCLANDASLGEATNTYKAKIESYNTESTPKLVKIDVRVKCTGPLRNYAEYPAFIELRKTNNVWGGPEYWGATNSFCGPMKLFDENGEEISLLKKEVSQPEAYPDSYNFRPLQAHYFELMDKLNHQELRKYKIPGDVDTEMLTKTNVWYLYKEFNLDECFNIKKPGKYKLIVWPVFYQLSETNVNIYKKIELKPISHQIEIIASMIGK